jgi:hypothetical protein
VIGRHAFGDQYRATDTLIPGDGRLMLTFTPNDGSEPIELDVFDFPGDEPPAVFLETDFAIQEVATEEAVCSYVETFSRISKAALDSSVQYLAWDLGQKNIRVNAISAGPVRTLAARSIAGFPTMESIVAERAPLRRNIDAEDVGAAAAFLLSDEARNVTGTTLYVDSGYHAMGM